MKKWLNRRNSPRTFLAFAFLLLIVCSANAMMNDSEIIIASGRIIDSSYIKISIDVGVTVSSNNLSTGFQISFGSNSFITNSQMRELAKDANFKMVRFYDTLEASYIPSMMPCTWFNENSQTGTYNWTSVDNLVQKILDIGAQPLICLGTFEDGKLIVPLGMAINSNTNLPDPESYAVYCAQWITHFKTNGWNVRFYEIVNEPWTYFGWEPVNYTKLAEYMKLFNACATHMRQENPNLVISFDFIGRKPVMDYWLANGGADVDSINFHKYDDWTSEGKIDEEMLADAETEYFGKWPLGYSLTEARQKWFDARGKFLPIINSESNFNSAWENGTDPRIQQMVGAVWTALVLRMGILNGVSYNIYWELAESSNWGRTTQTGGYGFGMIDSDNLQPWYPYYVNYLIANNIGTGDLIKESSSSSEEIRVLPWVHGQTLNVLLICRVDQTRTISIYGVEGEGNIEKIDSTISWEHPYVQSGNLNFYEPLVLNGYTVALLQKRL